MSKDPDFGFGKLVPGFDFLQNLAKGASQSLPQMPSLSNWVAPTLDPKELDKRIGELKAVQFWLEQNSKALAATIQALEVQKMTLATLKGMNFQMDELAKAMQMKGPGAAMAGTGQPAAKQAASQQPKPDKPTSSSSAGVIDPLQWWGALTQQFQEIAAGAMKDVAAQASALSPADRGTAGKPKAAKAGAKRAAKKSGR